MKKIAQIATLLLLATLTLNAANTGEEIYEANCKSCHMLKPMMDKQKMMSMSQAERMSMKEKMMQTMKAPPMSKISAKLKYDFKNDKAQVVAFVKEYIVDPNAEKAHCMPMALKKFGVMPAIGKSLSKKDLDTISNWMVNNFDEKWDANDQGMMCNMKKGKGKNGAGMKQKNTPKPAALKCSTGKCGAK